MNAPECTINENNIIGTTKFKKNPLKMITIVMTLENREKTGHFSTNKKIKTIKMKTKEKQNMSNTTRIVAMIFVDERKV